VHAKSAWADGSGGIFGDFRGSVHNEPLMFTIYVRLGLPAVSLGGYARDNASWLADPGTQQIGELLGVDRAAEQVALPFVAFARLQEFQLVG
jgi:hypothetical protein